MILVFGWAIIFWDIALYGSEFGPGLLRPDFTTWTLLWIVGIAVVILGYVVATKEKD